MESEKSSLFAAAVVSAVTTSQAQADFTYDLRFTDGSHSRVLAPSDNERSNGDLATGPIIGIS